MICSKDEAVSSTETLMQYATKERQQQQQQNMKNIQHAMFIDGNIIKINVI